MEVKPLAPQSTRKYKTEEASIAKESVKAKMAIFVGIVVIPLYKLQFMLYKWQTYRLRSRRLCAKVRRTLGNNLSGGPSPSAPFWQSRWGSALLLGHSSRCSRFKQPTNYHLLPGW